MFVGIPDFVCIYIISGVCPAGYDYLAGYNCYIEITNTYTWADAVTNCQGIGAYLACIETQQEWAMVKPWAVSTGKFIIILFTWKSYPLKITSN